MFFNYKWVIPNDYFFYSPCFCILMNPELRHNITKLLMITPNKIYLKHFFVVCHEEKIGDSCWPRKVHKVP